MAGRFRSLGLISTLVAFVGVVGCRAKKVEPPQSSDADDVSFVEDGTDTTSAESDAQLLTSSLISSTSSNAITLASVDLSGADLGARDIGDAVTAIFFPRLCLRVANDPATQTATYVFNRCSGPNGLRLVTGTVKVHYAQTDTSLTLDITADALQVNEAIVDWSANAAITLADGMRTMSFRAQLSGQSAGGRVFSRNTETTVSWQLGDPCFALSGFSEGTIRRATEDESKQREIRVDVSNFRRCRRGCPDPGGKIVVTNVTRNLKVELLYDGSNQATFVTPKGRAVTVPLFCRP